MKNTSVSYGVLLHRIVSNLIMVFRNSSNNKIYSTKDNKVTIYSSHDELTISIIYTDKLSYRYSKKLMILYGGDMTVPFQKEDDSYAYYLNNLYIQSPTIDDLIDTDEIQFSLAHDTVHNKFHDMLENIYNRLDELKSLFDATED